MKYNKPERSYDKVHDEYLELSDTFREYIRIYHAYFVLQWETHDICEHFKCGVSKVNAALKWVIDNKQKFPPEYLLEGAIFAVRERMKMLRKMYDEEAAKTKLQDRRLMSELLSQLRTDEDKLFKLQQTLAPTSDKEKGIAAADVLKLISAAKE